MPPKKKPSPKAGPKTAPDPVQGARRMTLTLGDKTLDLPSLPALTLSETFAILNATGAKAETLWEIELDKPIGRASVTAWWWIARSREVGTLLPLQIVDKELTEAAANGIVVTVASVASTPEDADPEG